jgi:hypothetical protein
MSSNKTVSVILLAAAVLLSMLVGPIAVRGQQDAGEIRVEFDSGKTELEQGNSETIEIYYQSSGSDTPNTVEFDLAYDQNVLSIDNSSVKQGGYLNGISSVNVSDGTVTYFDFTIPENPTVNPDEPVATIEIESAEGADVDDQTTLEFTDVLIKPDSIRTPETVNKTVTIAKGEKNTPNYNVGIEGTPTLSPPSVDSTPSDHTLNFDVVNVSADDEPDNFTVTLPEKVTIEDITNTTVTDTSGKPIAVSDDPADDDNPGRELKFAVDPNSQETAVKTLTVEVEMELSATP